ncbi:amidase [Tsukamurella sp. 8F]|uniref:amidase n=1 Tax=unclassified Tsukamurella TaxID=2633480 RepID=UPI0023B8899C|nr:MULTISPECIES: amidase [unclassified Tsukamurella]MDF0528487.1 amidase [Tsukamurella sp. 8J]MDF0586313.1 amidase [Tsukamurella sp. 8F]
MPMHAFSDDALGASDALALADAVRTGAVAPRELAAAALSRAEAVAALNAVAHTGYDESRPIRGGLFAGVPTYVKDNTDVEGMPTRYGSAAFGGRLSRRTSAPARQFLAQGFTPLGKSTMPEFGLTASTEYAGVGRPAAGPTATVRPPTRNPWDPERSVGGSSGGAAALVASGVVPLAHGNDGGGSLRIPAACAGLVGLKPARSRMQDPPGTRQLPVNLVTEGVLTRTVRDTAHYLAAAEAFSPATGLDPIGLVRGPSDRRFRIGLVVRDARGRDVDPQVRDVVESAARVFAGAGHTVEPVELEIDPRFIDDFTLYWAAIAGALVASSKASHGKDFRPADLDPFTTGLLGLLKRSSWRIGPAVARLRQTPRVYARQLGTYDMLLSPVLSTPPPPLGEYRPDQPFDDLLARLVDYVGFTPLGNLSGAPAVALPHTVMPCGLPGSIQLAGGFGDEATLLDAAYQFEALAPFPTLVGASTAAEVRG